MTRRPDVAGPGRTGKPRGWTHPDGEPVAAPEPPCGRWWAATGDLQGRAYERNAFAQGSDAEVAALRERLGLAAGDHVVDVGCATGRHARRLAAAGCRVTGVDCSAGLLRAAAELAVEAGVAGVRWVQGDAAALPLRTGCADAALSLCQGGFGHSPDADRRVLAELARILRPGGRLALTAFSLAFAARFAAAEDAFDLTRGLVHTVGEVRDGDGHPHHRDLWTVCYSPAHLAERVAAAGLSVESLTGCEPGSYASAAPPRITDPEFMVVATRNHERQRGG